jgi:hypothetical protein
MAFMSQLDFPLYHGTCTLFLESIAQHGLGGWDPIKEWRVLECLRKVLPIAEKHAVRSEIISSHIGNARSMAEQVNAGLNFQHGSVYLSPSKETAVRYACGKKKGSELISRTILLIEELCRLEAVDECGDISQDYPELLSVLNINPAPVLIRVECVDADMLLSEKGESPDDNLAKISGLQVRMPDCWEQISQQLNFRLTRPIPAKELMVSLIAVRRQKQFSIDYALMPIGMEPCL